MRLRFFVRAACGVLEEEVLLDLFPVTAPVRNIWEDQLALVKGERVGAIIATEG